MAFSADGKNIASGSGGGHFFINQNYPGEIKVWDAATGQEKLALKGHTSRLTSVAFSTDGTRIVSASHDGTVKIWEVPLAKPEP